MRKRFLGVWSNDGGFQVEIEQTLTDVLQRPRGRIGALVPAVATAAPAALPERCTLVFLIPSRPNELLAVLTNDLGPSVRDRTYLTHGHASVVLILGEDQAWESIRTQAGDLVSGYECWPVENGRANVDDVTWAEPIRADLPPVEDIPWGDLGYESAAQIRQFNANLSLLAREVSIYAPEIWPLISSMHAQVSQIADGLRADDPSILEHAKRVSSETVLIETNAVVTLYCSQLGSGTLPLHRSTFPVGEYSLFGIGGMCRAAWRLYEHLNQTFAKHDHPTMVRNLYPKMASFDPFGPSSARRDFTTWRQTNFALHQLPEASEPADPRYHVPYFSSRWGFHESLHAISLSWQCLYASATKEWNLLTVTHEFLHAQVRAIFSEIMRPEPGGSDLASQIADRYNSRQGGNNAREAMQVAFVEALIVYRAAAALGRSIHEDSVEEGGDVAIGASLTAEALHELVREHTGIVHEIVVHVLDFRYIYAARDVEYVQSIWCSWSLVPGVADQIEHYVLRTLCALSAVTDLSDTATNKERFEEAKERMRDILGELCTSERVRPVLIDALAVFTDTWACKRLAVQFSALRYVVELAQTFLYDERLNTELMADSQTDEDQRSGRFVYGLTPGIYEGRRIESPVGFLLDRFPRYSDRAGSDDAEFDSIWQMLQLT